MRLVSSLTSYFMHFFVIAIAVPFCSMFYSSSVVNMHLVLAFKLVKLKFQFRKAL